MMTETPMKKHDKKASTIPMMVSLEAHSLTSGKDVIVVLVALRAMVGDTGWPSQDETLGS